jgi:hypothetical protein
LDKSKLAVEAQKFTPRIKIPVLDQSSPAEMLTIKYAPSTTVTELSDGPATV